MKLKNVIMIAAMLLPLSGCYEENDFKETPSLSEYDLSDSDTDPIQHERYKLYRDYGVILIDSVKPSDYLYTMTESSPVRMTASLLSVEQKLEAIRFIREILYDAYPGENIKLVPVKCILANKLYEEYSNPGGTTREDLDAYLGASYFAFAVTPAILNVQKNKERFTSSVVSQFVIKGLLEKKYGGYAYLDLFEPMFLEDEEAWMNMYITFGNTNPGNYPGQDFGPEPDTYPYDDFKTVDVQDFAYQLGVPGLTKDEYVKYVNETESYPVIALESRYKNWIADFITWSLLKSDAEKSQVLAKYPRFKARFDVIGGLLKKYVDIELK